MTAPRRLCNVDVPRTRRLAKTPRLDYDAAGTLVDREVDRPCRARAPGRPSRRRPPTGRRSAGRRRTSRPAGAKWGGRSRRRSGRRCRSSPRARSAAARTIRPSPAGGRGERAAATSRSSRRRCAGSGRGRRWCRSDRVRRQGSCSGVTRARYQTRGGARAGYWPCGSRTIVTTGETGRYGGNKGRNVTWPVIEPPVTRMASAWTRSIQYGRRSTTTLRPRT